MPSVGSSEILAEKQLVSIPEEQCCCTACMNALNLHRQFQTCPYHFHCSLPCRYAAEQAEPSPWGVCTSPQASPPAATGVLPSRMGLVRCLSYAALCTTAQHHPRDPQDISKHHQQCCRKVPKTPEYITDPAQTNPFPFG